MSLGLVLQGGLLEVVGEQAGLVLCGWSKISWKVSQRDALEHRQSRGEVFVDEVKLVEVRVLRACDSFGDARCILS